MSVNLTIGTRYPTQTFSTDENDVFWGSLYADTLVISGVISTITGGDDANLFKIVGSGQGIASIISKDAFDYENKIDAHRDGIYEVAVGYGYSPGLIISNTKLFVKIDDVDDPPRFVDPILYARENTLVASPVVAFDQDAGAVLTYRITAPFGGDPLLADGDKFTIDPVTGRLSFINAPNFEAPGDANGDNVYDLQIVVSDGVFAPIREFFHVNVVDVNETPTITSFGGAAAASLVVPEIYDVATITATDQDPGTTLIYSIVGGADASAFFINPSTGRLQFITKPNFDAPTDVGRNNVYDVIVQASDGNSADQQALAVRVTANLAPTIIEPGGGTTAAVSVPENSANAATVLAVDDPGAQLRYSIIGGADASKFTINAATGLLSFVTRPNFELPTDNGGNNIYDVVVQVSDGELTDQQAIAVSVTDVVDAPVIVSGGGGPAASLSIAENTLELPSVATDTAASSVVYSIAGGADAAQFRITQNGRLFFLNAPNFEAPTDVGADNVYNVVVRASNAADVTKYDDQAIAITVTNVNDLPDFLTKNPVIVPENTRSFSIRASDQDGQVVTYSLPEYLLSFFSVTNNPNSGSNATTLTQNTLRAYDNSKFGYNSSTGEIRFLTLPDYESGTKEYQIYVFASDGIDIRSAVYTIKITDVNDNPPVITSNGGNILANLTVSENTTAVTTVTATDADETSVVTYAISGGNDAARFSIDSATGALSFIKAPDFEAPGSAAGTNSYVVNVTASDGTFSDVQTLIVAVTDANDAPVIASNGGGANAAVTVAENRTAVTTVTAFDQDPGTSLRYSISGGADAAKFAINATTGALTFLTAPNFEVPTDVGANNVYDVVVRASDGTLTADQALAVTVTDVNEFAPRFPTTNLVTVTVDENRTAVTTLTATDADGSAVLTYSISGGDDAARFAIDASSGALRFITAPDYEQPADANANNGYVVIVRASDGTLSAQQILSVVINDVNDNAPIISSNGGGVTASVSVAENLAGVTTVTATDADANTSIVYSIIGGVDAARFGIDARVGTLFFLAAPDFEAPGDADGNNIYQVQVRASDGTLFDDQLLSVAVTNRNDNAPVITTNGGGASAALSLAENSTAVTTVGATDADTGTTIVYSIAGGSDASKFTINPSTGALSFVTAPDFDAPTDVGGDNIYDVGVSASDGVRSVTQDIAVTVTDVNEFAPVIGSNGGGSTAAISIAENSTAVTTLTATDADGSAVVTYAITGGADAAKFAINAATGVLTFVSAPDFEAPTDVGGDNVYNVTVTASDGLRTDDQAIAVTVTNVNDNVPFSAFAPSANFAENGTGPAYQVIVSDADPGTTLSVTLSGPDAALFHVALVPTTDPRFSTARLTFKASPDFEAPADVGRDDVYDVTLRVSDGTLFSAQAAKIIVTNVNEAPVITSNGGGISALVSLAENNTAVTTVTATDPDAGTGLIYSIIGGADAAQFDIDASTGRLSFRNAPDFDFPTDADGNNSYLVQVRANDGVLFDDQTLTIAVTGVNESAPSITSNGGSAAAALSVAENSAAVTTLAATDADRGTVLVYSISGGADAALFAIDAGTGALSFVSASDFETPTDSGADNVYDVIVQVSDGSFVDTQALAVTVTNVNDAPVITSNGGGPAAAISLAENTTAVTAVTSTDPDAGASAVYAISGGADAALFTIDAATGALAFIAAPDFEAPRDAGGDNVYDVSVRVSDGSLFSDQAISVTVTDATDTFIGTPRKDMITGTNGDDVLNGLGDRDTLEGLDGNDRLDGGTGNDVMKGGQGDDTYIVDSNADKVVELADQGTDTVLTALAFYKLSDNVENLTFTYTEGAGSKGLGNALSNVLTGAASADTLVSYDGDDTLLGLGGNDTLNGGAGADLLDGGSGADTLIGGSGDDLYIVDNAGDVVREGLDGGYDTVQASVSFTLGANIEALLLTGTDAINGTGNRLDNWLDGNGADNILLGGAGNDALYGEDGNDTLEGGAGRDDLYGGAGADTFLFASKLTPAQGSAADFVFDFNSFEGDKLAFSKAVFTGLSALGVLDEDAFHAGTSANDASDRVIYDATTGNLYYDVDGIGRRPQVLVATVGAWEHPALTSADVLIVA